MNKLGYGGFSPSTSGGDGFIHISWGGSEFSDGTPSKPYPLEAGISNVRNFKIDDTVKAVYRASVTMNNDYNAKYFKLSVQPNKTEIGRAHV